MPEFLNTDGLREWIPRLINEAKRELVIITPYIKTSERVYEQLKQANKRGVETIIVYREESLSKKERAKLLSLDNLNLMHHPNVHAKCYLNEHHLIITSINMYEYSEENNREMGILIDKYEDDEEVILNAVKEINTIVKSAELERKSRETIEDKFELDIIKTELDKIEDYCSLLNKLSNNKRFNVSIENDENSCICENYFDNVNVRFIVINGRPKFEIKFNNKDKELEKIKNRLSESDPESLVKELYIFWSKNDDYITMYLSFKSEIMDTKTNEGILQEFLNGIKELYQLISK